MVRSRTVELWSDGYSTYRGVVVPPIQSPPSRIPSYLLLLLLQHHMLLLLLLLQMDPIRVLKGSLRALFEAELLHKIIDVLHRLGAEPPLLRVGIPVIDDVARHLEVVPTKFCIIFPWMGP